MIEYQNFQNNDPPSLVAVWRSQPPMRGRSMEISSVIFEQLVFSKPYFNHDDIITAKEDGKMVGFVHVGFGPDETRSHLVFDRGVICQLLVDSHPEHDAIAAELLARGQRRLIEQGAKTIQAGCRAPLDPYYFGLYGGAAMPGIPDSDMLTLAIFIAHGYSEIERTIVFHRDLTNFRPVVNRDQIQLRRRFPVETEHDPPLKNWWEACILGPFDRICFHLRPRGVDIPCGEALFWDLEPLARHWGARAIGMLDLQIDSTEEEGLDLLLLGESLRLLGRQGATLCETVASANDTDRIALLEQLRFKQVETGIVLEKSVTDD